MKRTRILCLVLLLGVATCTFSQASQVMDDNETIDDIFNQGTEEYRNQNYWDAIWDFSYVIDKRKDNYNAYLWRAAAYQEYRDYELAAADLTRAINIMPFSYSAYQRRGTVYYYMEKYREARLDYDKAIEINPDDTGSIKMRAMLNFRIGNYAESLADCESALALDPDLKWMDSYKGYILLKLGRYRESLTHLDRAEKSGYFGYNDYYTRGEAYLGLKNREKAFADFKTATELMIEYGLSQCYGYLDGSKAVESLEMAIEMYHGDHRAHKMAARLYLAAYDVDRAAWYLKDAARIAPGDPEVSRLLGEAEYMKGNSHEALNYLLAAAGKSPGDQETNSLLARVFAQLGDLEKALKHMKRVTTDKETLYTIVAGYLFFGDAPEKATKIIAEWQAEFPGSVNMGFYRWLALSEKEPGKSDYYLSEALKFIEGEEDKTDAMIVFGWLLFGKGEYRRAIQLMEEAEKLAPEGQDILAGILKCSAHFKAGDYDKSFNYARMLMKRIDAHEQFHPAESYLFHSWIDELYFISACSGAEVGNKVDALDNLRRASEHGYRLDSIVHEKSCMEPLKALPGFKKIMHEIEDRTDRFKVFMGEQLPFNL